MNRKTKRACITGAFGQDGSYLSEHLLRQGYEVLGLVHGDDVHTQGAIFQLLTTHPHFTLCVGNLSDLNSFASKLDAFAPDEMYNIAAISDLKTAREHPERTMEVNFHAVRNLVEHSTRTNSEVRIFQALSSRILAPDMEGVIREDSVLMEPQNAYDKAKRASYEEVVLPYRNKGFFIASGFLCNHESPRRGERFVTGKIALSVARMYKGLDEKIEIGNIEAKRDWSFAGDVVRAMHATLQTQEPHDYVIGSGELHTVKEYIDQAFLVVGKQITWNGYGVDARGYDESGVLRVEVNPAFYQADDNFVVSDTSFLENTTPWKREVSFSQLVEMMVRAELTRIVSS